MGTRSSPATPPSGPNASPTHNRSTPGTGWRPIPRPHTRSRALTARSIGRFFPGVSNGLVKAIICRRGNGEGLCCPSSEPKTRNAGATGVWPPAIRKWSSSPGLSLSSATPSLFFAPTRGSEARANASSVATSSTDGVALKRLARHTDPVGSSDSPVLRTACSGAWATRLSCTGEGSEVA
eukprot:scaffold153837_cov36-Tisochrysis_lutea.AAC.4